MRKGRPLYAIPPVYGSVEVIEGRAIYTDEKGRRWRLHDFTGDGPTRRSLPPGSPEAKCRVWVREDGKERRRALFQRREDTLTASFNYHAIATATVREGGRWVFAAGAVGADRMTTSKAGNR
jgi:hypothetical protein